MDDIANAIALAVTHGFNYSQNLAEFDGELFLGLETRIMQELTNHREVFNKEGNTFDGSEPLNLADIGKKVSEYSKFNIYVFDSRANKHYKGFTYLIFNQKPNQEGKFEVIYGSSQNKTKNKTKYTTSCKVSFTKKEQALENYIKIRSMLRNKLPSCSYALWTDASEIKGIPLVQLDMLSLNKIPKSRNGQVPKRGCPGGSIYT